ncbi:UNVERIFIED_CONTAM: uncharacterized protein with ParB-like and HNH nuclease domain [Williamsia faeni]
MPQNEPVSLSSVVNDRLLHIPDYQRPYAWEKKQLDDLWEDLDLLGPIATHYAGTLVLRAVVTSAGSLETSTDDLGDTLTHFEVVDGQQRLTSCFILLDRIRRRLLQLPATAAPSAPGVADNLRRKYGTVSVSNVETPRLRLGKELADYWLDNVLGDSIYVGPALILGQRRLQRAAEIFDGKLADLERGVDPQTRFERLRELQRRVTSQFGFLVHEVQDLAEVGVIFETLNERGRPLSELEKAKNYLLYLARLIPDGRSEQLAVKINAAWADIFRNLSTDDGLDDQLLRAHWLTTQDPDRKNWRRVASLKTRFDRSQYVTGQTRLAPVENAADDNDAAWDQLNSDISDYVKTLRDSSYIMRDMFDASAGFEGFATTAERSRSRDAGQALQRSGIVAPYRPLLIASRLKYPTDGEFYANLVDLCERYSARVFVIQQRRTNTGEPTLLRLAHALYDGTKTPDAVIAEFEALLWNYASDSEVASTLESTDQNWYYRRGHKYFLYEYERSLMKAGDQLPKLVDLSDASGPNRTTEHILPQNPNPKAKCWSKAFTIEEHAALHHSLGNLALTLDNSSYGNKCFSEKRGTALGPGVQASTCYAQGNLRQEQELATYQEWTPSAIRARQKHLAAWALRHWAVKPPAPQALTAVDEAELEGNDPSVADD